MMPRALIVLAQLAALGVATSAAAVAAASSIDFDLDATNGGGDYEVLGDAEEERKPASDDDDVAGIVGGDVGEAPRGRAPSAPSTPSAATAATKTTTTTTTTEVRCYCNQPHCVSQGYMCRGRGCFTELPLPRGASRQQQQQQLLAAVLASSGRPEHAAHSGCLTGAGGGPHATPLGRTEKGEGVEEEEEDGERPCGRARLCCEQDLCNHVDSPAMRSRLNRTVRVLLGEHRAYFGSMRPAGREEVQATADGWFRTATIAVPICGFVVLLVLASLAVRLLHQPVPSQADKLHGLGAGMPGGAAGTALPVAGAAAAAAAARRQAPLLLGRPANVSGLLLPLV